MEPDFHLIILHVPGRQKLSDFQTIRNMMTGRADDIALHIVSQGQEMPADFWPKMAAKPTLIFAPQQANIDPRIRGTRLMATPMSKWQEYEALIAAKLPVPQMVAIQPGITLKPAEWGEYVVTKPLRGSRGRGIFLVQTKDTCWVDPKSFPEDSHRRGQEWLFNYLDSA
jgi:hypothetical protein